MVSVRRMRIAAERRDVPISLEVVTQAAPSTSLGPAPRLVRALRILGAKTVAPFAPSKEGLRELFVREPRMTRLWERFSIDIGIAVERDAAWFAEHVFDRMNATGRRVLVVEDGDRYAIRAACVFEVVAAEGRVLELLHDRTVAGMRGASRVLGHAVREMVDAGATRAEAWSFAHSGSFPILLRHAFVPRPDERSLVVHVDDDDLRELASARSAWYVSGLDLME